MIPERFELSTPAFPKSPLKEGKYASNEAHSYKSGALTRLSYGIISIRAKTRYLKIYLKAFRHLLTLPKLIIKPNHNSNLDYDNYLYITFSPHNLTELIRIN